MRSGPSPPYPHVLAARVGRLTAVLLLAAVVVACALACLLGLVLLLAPEWLSLLGSSPLD